MRASSAFAVAITLCSIVLPAQTKPSFSSLRKAVIDAKSDETKGKAYRALFESIDRTKLATLADDPDTSLALQATWELARLPFLRDPVTHDLGLYRFDPLGIDRLLGAIDRRTGLEPPEWWAEYAKNGGCRPESHSGTDFFGPLEVTRDKYGFYQEGITMQEKDSGLLISDGRHRFVIPKDAPTETMSGHRPLFVKFVGGLAFAAMGEPIAGFPYDLVCFDLLTGKLAWSKLVWASFRGDFGGYGVHAVEIVVQGKQVGVFGSGLGVYAEGFDLRDGTPRFRFCTSYWSQFSSDWHLDWLEH